MLIKLLPADIDKDKVSSDLVRMGIPVQKVSNFVGRDKKTHNNVYRDCGQGPSREGLQNQQGLGFLSESRESQAPEANDSVPPMPEFWTREHALSDEAALCQVR